MSFNRDAMILLFLITLIFLPFPLLFLWSVLL